MSEPTTQRAKDWLNAAKTNPLFWRGVLGAAAVLVADQASKFWIVYGLDLPARRQIDLSAVFDLTFVRNRGASFGMLAGGMVSRTLLSLIALGVSAALIGWLARLDRRIAATGVAFIVGGALGNMIDRARLGYVVDFLDFSGLYFPWVFNIADVAINLGIVCLIIDAYLEHKRETAAKG